MICGVSFLVAAGFAYPNFQAAIPNGDKVVNPCDLDGVRGQPWPGVGHRQTAGSGTRNPFGNDWARNGWVSSDVYRSVVKHPHVNETAKARGGFYCSLDKNALRLINRCGTRVSAIRTAMVTGKRTVKSWETLGVCGHLDKHLLEAPAYHIQVRSPILAAVFTTAMYHVLLNLNLTACID